MKRTNGGGTRGRFATVGRAMLVTVCAGALTVACSSAGAGAGAVTGSSASSGSGSGATASSSGSSTGSGSAAPSGGGAAASGAGSDSNDSAPSGPAASGEGSGSVASASGSSPGSGGAASSGSGGAAALPSSCKAVLAFAARDLGATLAYAEATTNDATELDCNFYESSEAKDNGAGYVSMTWAVMDSADIASLTFGTTASMTFGDEKAQPVSGIGDKAVALTSDGTVAQLNVLSGASLLSVGQIQYDTPIALAKWTALAKDLLGGAA